MREVPAELVKSRTKKKQKTAVGSVRARNTVNDILQQIQEGKQPNVYQTMLKHGYSVYSAKAHVVKNTKEWGRVMDKLDDDVATDRLVEIIKQGKDSDSLKAIDMQMKLKNRYPTKITGSFSVNRKIEELYD